MHHPKHLKYSKSHEWLEETGPHSARIGLTDFAQKELGDLVFVNLPEAGDPVTVDESFADVESVKAVSDVYSPVGGVITAVNQELLDAPQLINEKPYEAWLIEVGEISGTAELLDADAYEAFCGAQAQ